MKAGLFKNKYGNATKSQMRLRIEIPLRDLIKKLHNNKFTRLNEKGEPTAKARKDLTNFAHHEIIKFYNSRIQGLYNFYSFAANLNSLRVIIMFLQQSCALTLALKYKLRTKRRTFSRFGRLLKDPGLLRGDTKLKIPRDLKVMHKYNNTETKTPDNELKMSLFKKDTVSVLNKTCIICKASHNIEMHHVRKAKDVRHKIKTGKSTYAQWVGSYLR